MFYVELIASYLDIHPSMNDDASDASYCGESLGCCRSQAQHYSVSILIDGAFFWVDGPSGAFLWRGNSKRVLIFHILESSPFYSAVRSRLMYRGKFQFSRTFFFAGSSRGNVD